MNDNEKKLYNYLVDLTKECKMITYGDAYDFCGLDDDFRSNTEIFEHYMGSLKIKV